MKGDHFVVKTNSIWARAILYFEKLWSFDHKANRNHAGIILDGTETFEALTRITKGDLKGYVGCEVTIARDVRMSPLVAEVSTRRLIDDYDGMIYPYHRMLFHATGTAKFIHWKFPVCSELCAMDDYRRGWRRQWWGVTPDSLEDGWRYDPNKRITYRGLLTQKILEKIDAGEL